MLSDLASKIEDLIGKYKDYPEVADDLAGLLAMTQALLLKLAWRKK